jgi:hypothetical protein
MLGNQLGRRISPEGILELPDHYAASSHATTKTKSFWLDMRNERRASIDPSRSGTGKTPRGGGTALFAVSWRAAGVMVIDENGWRTPGSAS